MFCQWSGQAGKEKCIDRLVLQLLEALLLRNITLDVVIRHIGDRTRTNFKTSGEGRAP